MKKMILLAICGVSMMCVTGCAPTIATMSVTETVASNGEKTVATTKSLSQHVSVMQTSSTDQVLEKFKQADCVRRDGLYPPSSYTQDTAQSSAQALPNMYWGPITSICFIIYGDFGRLRLL